MRFSSSNNFLWCTFVLTLGTINYVYLHLGYRETSYEVPKRRTPNSSYTDLWRTSFSQPSLLESAPLGSVLAPVHKALDTAQNPSSCSSASFFILEYTFPLANGSVLGFGAQIKHITISFYQALRAGRIFVFSDRLGFDWADGCKTGVGKVPECFFRSLTNCTRQTLRALMNQGKLKVHHIKSKSLRSRSVPIIPKADPKKPSVIIFRMTGINEPWVFSLVKNQDAERLLRSKLGDRITKEQEMHITPIRNARRTLQVALATYFMRLNDETALKTGRAMTQVLHKYGLTRSDHKRVIGVPVRKSDKCVGAKIGNHAEMECYNTSTILDAARRIALANPSITHVLLTSEDASAIRQGVEYEDSGRKWSETNNLTVMRNFLDILPNSGGVGARKDKSRAELVRSMLITLHLQAFASYHVLTPRSTFHSLINCVALATPGKNIHYFYPLVKVADLKQMYAKQLMR